MEGTDEQRHRQRTAAAQRAGPRLRARVAREKASLKARLATMLGERIEIPLIIGGEEVRTGNTVEAVCPHDHGHVLADVHQAGPAEVERAIAAAAAAWHDWSAMAWEERAAVFLKAAELLAGPWRDTRQRRHHAQPVEDASTRPRSTRPAS